MSVDKVLKLYEKYTNLPKVTGTKVNDEIIAVTKHAKEMPKGFVEQVTIELFKPIIDRPIEQTIINAMLKHIKTNREVLEKLHYITCIKETLLKTDGYIRESKGECVIYIDTPIDWFCKSYLGMTDAYNSVQITSCDNILGTSASGYKCTFSPSPRQIVYADVVYIVPVDYDTLHKEMTNTVLELQAKHIYKARVLPLTKILEIHKTAEELELS